MHRNIRLLPKNAKIFLLIFIGVLGASNCPFSIGAESTIDLSKGPYPEYRYDPKLHNASALYPGVAPVHTPEQKAPQIRNLEYENGFFIYRDNDLGNVTLTKLGTEGALGFETPFPEMKTDKLVAFGTPGERVSTYFKLLPERDGLVPEITVSTLKNREGKVFPNSRIALFRLRNWITRYNEKYFISPEFLEPMDMAVLRDPTKSREIKRKWLPRPTMFDMDKLKWIKVDTALMKKNNPETFFFEIKIPEDVAPGLYRGAVELQRNGKALRKMTLFLRVLDFKLLEMPVEKKSWRMWGLPSDLHRNFKDVSNEEILDYFKELREAGIESFLFNATQVLKKDPAYKLEIKNGRIVDFSSPNFDRVMRCIKRSGFKGNLVIDLGAFFERNLLLKKLPGRYGEKGEGKACLMPKDWTPELRRDIVDFISVLKKKMDSYGVDWALKVCDEPHSPYEESLHADAMHPLLHDNVKGLKLSATITVPSLKRWGKWLDPKYSMVYAMKDKGRAVETAARWANGRELGTGIIGAWVGMLGNMSLNRRRGGFLFYRYPSLNSMNCWTWQYGIYDYYNSFDHAAGDRFIGMPPQDALTSDRPVISSPQWEGIKAAIVDCRYAYTLEQYIDKSLKSSNPDKRKEAEKIKKEWREILKSLPWDLQASYAQNVRWWIALQIERLIHGGADNEALDSRKSPQFKSLLIPNPSKVSAQKALINRRVLQIPFVPSGVKLDGALSEEWKKIQAIHLGGKEEGLPASQKTDVRFACDKRYLYVFFECMENNMSNVRMPENCNNSPVIWDGDLVEIFLQVNLTGNSYFHFAANGVGSWFAQSLSKSAAPDLKKNAACIWKVSGFRGKDQWNVEAKIDLAELKKQEGIETDFILLGAARTRRPTPSRNEYMCFPADCFHKAQNWQLFQLGASSVPLKVDFLALPGHFLLGNNILKMKPEGTQVKCKIKTVDNGEKENIAETMMTSDSIPFLIFGRGDWNFSVTLTGQDGAEAKLGFETKLNNMALAGDLPGICVDKVSPLVMNVNFCIDRKKLEDYQLWVRCKCGNKPEVLRKLDIPAPDCRFFLAPGQPSLLPFAVSLSLRDRQGNIIQKICDNKIVYYLPSQA